MTSYHLTRLTPAIRRANAERKSNTRLASSAAAARSVVRLAVPSQTGDDPYHHWIVDISLKGIHEGW